MSPTPVTLGLIGSATMLVSLFSHPHPPPHTPVTLEIIGSATLRIDFRGRAKTDVVKSGNEKKTKTTNIRHVTLEIRIFVPLLSWNSTGLAPCSKLQILVVIINQRAPGQSQVQSQGFF